MRAFILIGIAVGVMGGCKRQNSAVAVAKLEPVSSKVTVEPKTPVPEPQKPDDTPPGPVAGGGGAGQAVRGTAKKTVDMNDFRQIHTFIEYASGATGRMPTTEQTRAALKQESPEIEQKIYEGLIVLCAAKNREEVWAYEAKALESGGLVATHNGVETLDAATLKRRLGK
jgi:hypothetical protein